ncbi:MAG TPA: ferredoxin family protein [Planctomycetes bacterium]|nr:ferredoxin family protein [Planctomycetota bacterium]
MQRLPVFISQGQSRNPIKRELETLVSEQLAQHQQLDVIRIPNLYDLTPANQSLTTLQDISGDFVIITWLYDRSTHWILNRNKISGQVGEIELIIETDDEDAEMELEDEDEKERVVASLDIPNRKIFSLSFPASNTPEDFVNEVLRIAELPRDESLTKWIKGKPNEASLQRFMEPTNDTALQGDGTLPILGQSGVTQIEDSSSRRWYPVIDYSRCTNCMECIDFCLFGVYGVDRLDTILVEAADNCRKGCPACSRVCPENAIVFPQHKSPAIAGGAVDAGGLKIDLSLLFGAPDAQDTAARERDEQLMLAGRAPVEITNDNDLEFVEISMQRRQTATPGQAHDPLDSLIDSLESFDEMN